MEQHGWTLPIIIFTVVVKIKVKVRR